MSWGARAYMVRNEFQSPHEDSFSSDQKQFVGEQLDQILQQKFQSPHEDSFSSDSANLRVWHSHKRTEWLRFNPLTRIRSLLTMGNSKREQTEARL